MKVKPEAYITTLSELKLLEDPDFDSCAQTLINHTHIPLSDEHTMQRMIEDLYFSPLKKAELTEYCLLLRNNKPESERTTLKVYVEPAFEFTHILLPLPANQDLTDMFDTYGFSPTFYEPLIKDLQCKEGTYQPQHTCLSTSYEVNISLNSLRNEILTITFQTDTSAYQQLVHCRHIPKQSLNPLSEYVQTQIDHMPPAADDSAPTTYALSIDYHSLRYVAIGTLSMFQAIQAHKQRSEHPDHRPS